MSFEKLEIFLLALNGKVERRIRCFAGRVTVLRESAPGDLDGYVKVLAGAEHTDRFTVLVDEQAYDASSHCLVGFNETFSESDGKVRDYLLRSGMGSGEIDGLLLKVGLGGTRERSCTSLNPVEQRTLRVLAATCSSGKMLVLNDPFLGLDSSFLEALAERVVNFAWRSKAIVLVLNLSNRPECWIDNELIARIQVGGVRRRTIGFGSSSPELKELVESIRADSRAIVQPSQETHQQQGVENLTAYSPIKGIHAAQSGVPKRMSLADKSRFYLYLGSICLTALATTAVLLITDAAPLPDQVTAATSAPEQSSMAVAPKAPSNNLVTTTSNLNAASAQQPSEQVSVIALQPPKAIDNPVELQRQMEQKARDQVRLTALSRIAPGSILSGYSSEIQYALMTTYDQVGVPQQANVRKDFETEGSGKAVVDQSAKKPDNSKQFLVELEKYSTADRPRGSSVAPGYDLNDQAAELARRREEILRRFLQDR